MMLIRSNKLPAIRFHAMGTEIFAAGKDAGILPYWRMPLYRFFESVERMASRFLPDSELSRFNRAPFFHPVKLSPRLYEMVRLAWSWSTRTEGLFQPFVGSDLCKLGYDRSFEHLKKADLRQPLNEAADRSLVERNLGQSLLLNDKERTAVRNTPFHLDLGGIGKGWCADRAAEMLQESFHVTKGIIDAGGDMRVWSDDEPWLVGIQSPFDEEKELLQLVLRNAAVATSNVLHRRWVHEGKWVHHILNGRTGLPTETDIVQATVLGRSAAEAEVAAKVICMAGSEQLSDWMKAFFPGLGYIAVTRSGSIKINRRVYEYAERLAA
jgi:thiamine biosynthesis lipoprotein